MKCAWSSSKLVALLVVIFDLLLLWIGTDLKTECEVKSQCDNVVRFQPGQCRTTWKVTWCLSYVTEATVCWPLGPGKTRTHCGGNIVSCDVARPWQNEATLLRAARTQEMFLKIFRNIFCVQDTNVVRMAKRGHIWETWSRQQCCRHNVSSFCQPLTLCNWSLHPWVYVSSVIVDILYRVIWCWTVYYFVVSK